ncbi:MAG: DUF2270 domain-containing protein [Anaerolineae bacterium]|nr:DUF2270 domain-containing protein [Anaerolineae bacterium]
MDVPRNETCTDSPTWTYQGYHLGPGNFTTAMVHLYRAEVTRTNTWRSRLDATTNWAVVTTAAALTFTFSAAQNPHFVMLLVLVLVLAFMSMEARRYSYYSLWYHRVRLMETEFFAKMLVPPFTPAPDWADALNETLSTPTFPVSRWSALAIRYRRNYIWLLTLIVCSWSIKLLIHPTPALSFEQFVNRASIGYGIPGDWILGIVIAALIGLGSMMLIISLRDRGIKLEMMDEPAHRRRLFPDRRPEPRLAFVITNRSHDVADRIMRELSRGVTALQGTGMFTGKERNVLLCALTDVQIDRFEQIVSEVDPEAFLVFSQVSNVRGRGFAPFGPPPS